MILRCIHSLSTSVFKARKTMKTMKIFGSLFLIATIFGLTVSAGEILSVDGELPRGLSELFVGSDSTQTTDSGLWKYDGQMTRKSSESNSEPSTKPTDSIVSYDLRNASDQRGLNTSPTIPVDVSKPSRSTVWNWDRPMQTRISRAWRSAPDLLMQSGTMALSFIMLFSALFFMFAKKF